MHTESTPGETPEIQRIWYQGSCHCCGVVFEAQASLNLTITECNCSICHMSGHRELMVPDSAFRLHRGSHLLREYRFANCIADHTFCIICGVRPFYRPRSHPVGFMSVNARCLDLDPATSIRYVEFDGKNWARSIAAGQHVLTE